MPCVRATVLSRKLFHYSECDSMARARCGAHATAQLNQKSAECVPSVEQQYADVAACVLLLLYASHVQSIKNGLKCISGLNLFGGN